MISSRQELVDQLGLAGDASLGASSLPGRIHAIRSLCWATSTGSRKSGGGLMQATASEVRRAGLEESKSEEEGKGR